MKHLYTFCALVKTENGTFINTFMNVHFDEKLTFKDIQHIKDEIYDTTLESHRIKSCVSVTLVNYLEVEE